MSNLPEIAGPSGPKFLVTSEKTARAATAVGGGLIVAGAAYKALPYVIKFAEMGIEAGFKLGVLGVILAIAGLICALVLNPKTQTAIWYWYMGLADAIAFTVIKVDPVTRVRAYVGHYLEPMMARSQQLLDRAVGRQNSAQRRVEENGAALHKAEERAAYCLAHGSSDNGRTWINNELRTEFSVQSAKIRTMRDALKRLEKRLAFQKGCVVILRDLQNVIAAYTEVTRFNVDMMVEEFESAGEMAESGREVQGMLGKSEKTQFFQMTAQHLMQQTDLMMGEVEGVMSAVQKQISAGKIDDAIGEESLIRELTGRVGNMSAFAEGQLQLAKGGDAVLFNTAKTRVKEEVSVDDTKPAGISSNPSTSRFQNLLPPR